MEEAKEPKNPGNKRTIKQLNEQLSKSDKEEEIYCCQKARSKWLKEGDRNTAYFHASVGARRKKNTISCLQRKNGNWYETTKDMEEEICSFYQNIFKSL